MSNQDNNLPKQSFYSGSSNQVVFCQSSLGMRTHIRMQNYDLSMSKHRSFELSAVIVGFC